MNLEHLAAYLQGTYDLRKLKREIAVEVQNSGQAGGSGGTPVAGRVEEVFGETYAIGPNEVRCLCMAFIEGDLDAKELAYVSDTLQVSESFIWLREDLFDMVFEMSDPDINGPFTVESAEAMLDRLGPPAPGLKQDQAAG